MKRSFASVVLSLLMAACSSQQSSVLPLSTTLPSTADNYSIIWVGRGKSFLYLDGKYQRTESNDYGFEVVQRRYGDSWKSVKNMHRIHPEYDGRAGAREQTMFFGIDYKLEGENIVSYIQSSLGVGKGTSDRAFRNQQLVIALEDVSSFAPYNMMRITQQYRYEDGLLLETVDLFKNENGREIPFVRIEEEAVIFRPKKLSGAPTVFDFESQSAVSE